MERVILHCDLNNFYASVECLYNPHIRNKPVAVCGSEENRHGIVLAKNYNAKKFGIKTGEPIGKAQQKCPHLTIVNPNYNLYLKFSNLAKQIYKEYTDLVESFGIDECWLDITGCANTFKDGERVAYIIKNRIKQELGITISIGVSYNKIFAKFGSDYKKPDAVTVITKQNFKQMIWNLPVEDLLYVGFATKKKLNNIGIYKIGELAKFPVDFFKRRLGKWGETLWIFANGYDDTPVLKVDNDLSIKGMGNSLTTPEDLTTNDEVKILFYVLSESIAQRLKDANLKGKTVQISIKDCEFNHIERQEQLYNITYLSSEIAQKAYEIFLKSWHWKTSIRALGIRVTNLCNANTNTQLSFLKEEAKQKKLESIEKCIDNIRSRFGHDSLQRAVMLKKRKLNANPVKDNIIHPVSYFKGGS